MAEHDFTKYPELTNKQMAELEFLSPHIQIKNDFRAVVDKVVDGDTIRLNAEFRNFIFPLRFLNIDSLEMSEGGDTAKQYLIGAIEGEEVEIKINNLNRVGKYGRLLGEVYHLGMNMGNAMLQLGYAVPFGKKHEGEPQPVDKMFSLKKWF